MNLTTSLLPPKQLIPTDISDYQEEIVTATSTAKALALKVNQQSRRRYLQTAVRQEVHPIKTKSRQLVLVYFPQDEAGKLRKLSQPWHSPYRITSRNDPDVTMTKIYFPEDQQILVHQSRVQVCPELFPQGFYWYGSKRHDHQ